MRSGNSKLKFKLANHILIVAGKKHLMTSMDLEQLKLVEDNYEQNNPNCRFVIECFGVKVVRREVSSGLVKEWEKVAGYSLWQIMPSAI